VLVGVSDVGGQLEAGVVVDVTPHSAPHWLGYSRIFLDVICEMVTADEEGHAGGTELSDVRALAAGIPAAHYIEVVAHLCPHLLPGGGGGSEPGIQLRNLIYGGAVVGQVHVAIYGPAARTRKVRLSGRDCLSA